MFAEMPLLQDLEFDKCIFLQDLVYAEPEKSLKLKVSQLVVVDCGTHYRQTIAQAIDRLDTGSLRTLGINFWAIKEQEWLRQSAIAELHLYAFPDGFWYSRYITELNVALVKAPQSLKVLRCMVDETVACNMAVDVLGSMTNDSAWEDLSSLCQLTLRMVDGIQNSMRDTESAISLCMNDNLPEMQRILHDKLGPVSTLSNLKYIEYFGNVFRLIDGEWSESEGVL